MQRLAGPLVVLAVVAVAGVAAWDAVRERGPAPMASTTPAGRDAAVVPLREPDRDVVAQLRRGRIEGMWTYVRGCETRNLLLPDLRDLGAQSVVTPCGRGERVTLRSPEPFVGREGDTLVIARCAPGGGDACRAMRFPSALLEGLPERLGVPGARRREVSVRDVARFSDGRVALLLDLEHPDPVPTMHVVATLDGSELVGAIPTGRQTLTRLEASPRGTYVTARPDLVLDSDGGLLLLPFAIGGEVRAVAWSPDERWTAFAASSGTFLVRTSDLLRLRETGLRPGLIRVPLVAHDLAWSGEP